MVHLPALPGSATCVASVREIASSAVAEAKLLEQSGFDAIMVENFGDTPFCAIDAPKPTIAAMAIILDSIRQAISLPMGVNLLRNDALGALALASVSGASFIRVNVLSGVYATDQGFIQGDAASVLAERSRLAPAVKIAADVHVKHARPLHQLDIAEAAEETAYRAGGDILIVSGTSTGRAADFDDVGRVKSAVPDRPVWIGSGMGPDTIGKAMKLCDGAIVGTSLKEDGKTTNRIDTSRLKKFMKAAGR